MCYTNPLGMPTKNFLKVYETTTLDTEDCLTVLCLSNLDIDTAYRILIYNNHFVIALTNEQSSIYHLHFLPQQSAVYCGQSVSCSGM